MATFKSIKNSESKIFLTLLHRNPTFIFYMVFAGVILGPQKYDFLCTRAKKNKCDGAPPQTRHSQQVRTSSVWAVLTPNRKQLTRNMWSSTRHRHCRTMGISHTTTHPQTRRSKRIRTSSAWKVLTPYRRRIDTMHLAHDRPPAAATR